MVLPGTNKDAEMNPEINTHQETISYYRVQEQSLPPPYSEEICSDQKQIEHDFIQRRTQWIRRNQFVPQVSRQPLLSKPVVIPRLAARSMMSSPLPFLRAYAPELQQLHVSVEDFTAFIDNLAVVQTEPAPLQALNLAGTGIGFIPYHWALAAGLAINASAMAGSKLLTKKRTAKYLEVVNRDYFNARGLKVSLYKDDDLSQLIGYPSAWPKLASIDRYKGSGSLRDRRMQVLAPYIAPLSLEVPPMAPQQKILDKMSAKLVAHTIAKQEKDARRKQRKLVEGEVTQEEIFRLEEEAMKKVKKMEYIVVEHIHLH